MRNILYFLLGFTLVLWAGVSFAAGPGSIVYKLDNTAWIARNNLNGQPATKAVAFTIGPSGNESHYNTGIQTETYSRTNDWYRPTTTVYVCSFNTVTNNYSWVARAWTGAYVWEEMKNFMSQSPSIPPGTDPGGQGHACEAGETNPCASKQGQDGAPIYTKLPYDSAFYDQAGICDNGCVAKPASGVTSNTYAQDGSGYIIGPWTYTGDVCETGVTPDLPPQPSPEDQDDAGEKACQSKCAGRAYQYDPATGQCQCFGAPGTIDPPLDPTVPAPDPGSPPVPDAQTPVPDPGGDAQLGAQIANQGKQIGQGDAQLAQLGGINNKLGSVISNQGKQLGQGDKILDYQRRQLGALEDIRNTLAEEKNEGENPGLPGSFDLDTSIGDSKNWVEHDDPDQVASDQATVDKNRIPSSPQLPMDIDLQISGSPVLSGVMFGRTIEIRFDRPWMETGYAIMAAMLVGIGYLQVFLMINRTLANNR